jgi:hypothetical protein
MIENAGRGNRMRKWHAAGLALVGWYLMVPPHEPLQPLSKWEVIRSYDSADQCQEFRQRFQELAVSMRENNSVDQEKHRPDDKELDAKFQRLLARASPNVDVIQDLTGFFLLLKDGRLEKPGNPLENSLATRWMAVLCIASDDPRLKP